jgi:hypothetical protein
MKETVIKVLLNLGYKKRRAFGGKTFTKGDHSIALGEVAGEFVTIRLSRTIRKCTIDLIGLLVTQEGITFLDDEHPALIGWRDAETISIIVALRKAMTHKKSPE